jgi:ABC-type transport system involved in cytochrome c biogenesis permease subunit
LIEHDLFGKPLHTFPDHALSATSLGSFAIGPFAAAASLRQGFDQDLTDIDCSQFGAMTLIDLANPSKFLALTARVLPWLMGLTAIVLLIGLYQSATAPDDYQQGATVKIMFIHVPNAWLSMFVWAVMSAASLGTLVWRHPLADVAAKAAAPIGAAFTFLALVTGSLWGRPMWGTIGNGMRG